MPWFLLSQLRAATIDRLTRRAAEVAYLEQFVQAQTLPTLMLCDCNITDTSQAYTQLRRRFRDSFQERGWGFGHTSLVKNIPFPVQRIDYIWHTPNLQTINTFIAPNANSDHFPITATLHLP